MNGELDRVSIEWIADKVEDVTKEKFAWILVQEPDFVGFCVMSKGDRLYCPPVLASTGRSEPDWERLEDLRLFGELGEWHVWRAGLQKSHWRARYWGEESESGSEQKPEILEEYHVLWGTRVDESPDPQWWCYSEERGIRIWLPFCCESLPLRLHVKQIIGYPNNKPLARIVDAVVCAITDATNKILLPAPSIVS